MFKNQLATFERYYKEADDSLQVETHLSVYEVYIEKGYDKEGNVLKNKDGSDRYFPIDDTNIKTLESDVITKKIRDDLFKPTFEVNGDVVELVTRDEKRIYYVVEETKKETLVKGTKVLINKNGWYKIVSEVGYVLVDDTDMDHERTLAVKPFSTEDHVKEAEDVVHASKYVHRRPEEN